MTQSNEGILEILVEHECSDLSSNLDPSQFTSYPVSLPVFEDVQQARTTAEAIVAVRLLRLQSIEEGGVKAVKVRVSVHFLPRSALKKSLPTKVSHRPTEALVESETCQHTRASRSGGVPGSTRDSVALDGQRHVAGVHS